MSEPIKKYRSGQVNAAIWQTEKGYSYTFQKSYKTKEGEWKNTNFFYDNDLLDLAILAQHIKSKVIDTPRKKQEPAAPLPPATPDSDAFYDEANSGDVPF